jgi:hypothetical protein
MAAPPIDALTDLVARVSDAAGATPPDVRWSVCREPVEWARSGAMYLTGRADGPPCLTDTRVASVARATLELITALSATPVPSTRVLGERAAYTGRARSAPWSVGGAFRALSTSDGWLGISLSRTSDFELLPAFIQGDVGEKPWQAIADWLAGTTSGVAAERAELLGLPAAQIPTVPYEPQRPGVIAVAGGRRRARRRPVVVDLSSLWAGPLCAHLLGASGARVIKVESRTRPDESRRATPEFFDMLHAGHEMVVLDFAQDRAELQILLRHADVVIEGSRPRALHQLGIVADDYVADGTIWVGISAYGRGSGAMRVGFGDDVAAGAGLVVRTLDGPWPVGDAIADPLAGLAAAAAAMLALRGERGCLLDVSMHDVAAECTAPADDSGEVVQFGNQWFVVLGGEKVEVRPPMRRDGAP